MKTDIYKELFTLSPFGLALVEVNTGKFVKINQSFENLLLYNKDELSKINFWDLILEEDRSRKESKHIKILIKDEQEISVKITYFLLEESDNLIWVQIEENKEQKEYDILYEDNKTLLEYITIENSLEKIFTKLINFAQMRNPDIICSILLLDKEKRHLLSGSAPNLPDFYTKAVNGVEIGEKIGSCGSAAYKKERVIVENIDTHENWQAFLDLTKKANLHSCWSEPIISSENEILGTFAIYTNSHKYPSSFEIKVIETYSNLASKAIEKDNYTKEIIKREKELEQLFNNTQIGLMYVSSKRILIKANQKLSEIFGYDSKEEMVGLNLSKFHLSKEKFEEFGKRYFNALKDGDKLDIEYQVKKKDNSIIWCQISGSTINKGDLSKGVLWMIKDISLTKKHEEELKKLNQDTEKLANSQKLLLSLFDTGDTVLFNWKNDENWTFEHVSLSAKKLFGYEKEEFLSGKISYHSCIHEDDFETVCNEVSNAIEKNLDYFKHKPYRVITKDGTEKIVLDNTVTLKNKNGEITNFIGYIVDISEQTKNQELIYHQSKIASIGEMLGNISHQWRQPLSAISTLATGSKLKKELEILSDNEFDNNMDLINNNAQYLSKTIDDFRNFFTSDATNKKQTNLKETFNTIYSLIKDSYRSSNINIIFDVPDTNLLINENIFVQAMLNILNNARDALDTNKEIEDKYVFVNLNKNEDNYLLIIKDNANGIPPKIKDKIFEPYFTTKHKSQGTGIGLYMTNQIISKQLQGKIIVNNVNYTYKDKFYTGASFEIKIPIL